MVAERILQAVAVLHHGVPDCREVVHVLRHHLQVAIPVAVHAQVAVVLTLQEAVAVPAVVEAIAVAAVEVAVPVAAVAADVPVVVGNY